MRQRTAVAAAALALAMGLTAACGAGSEDGGGSSSDKAAHTTSPKAEQPKPKPTPEPETSATPTGAAPKNLSQAELDKAILAKGDVPGFNVGPMDAPPPQGETPDKAECAPLTSVISGRPEPLAQASAYRQLTGPKDDRPAVSEFLTAHGQQGAVSVLSRLRAAVEACEGGFKATGAEGPSTYTGVKALPVARVGDDAVAYQVTGDFAGAPVPLVFEVVRSGSTLATFYTANFEGPRTPRVPPALLTAQVAKLSR
ncbi:hypothetical protein ACIHCQ_05285 [Streptomyces sp. NPDC052236]|uniref:hypothetical protein n=1 Tax=Streptomyces sp. NPDC052236 TaxID=3365686 RepID=UPI0037D0DE5B